MDRVEIDPELILRYAGRTHRGKAFHFEVSREDEMFLHAFAGYKGNAGRTWVNYLLQGEQMLAQVRQVAEWAFGGWFGVGRFLDFASGYGRFTRHLIEELPAERIVVSDVCEDAVRFQRERFGVAAVPSSTDPADSKLDGTFDLIYVSSLFSHLPMRTFRAWLAKLISLLSPHGLLLFSTNGTAPGDPDFVFRPESESRTLDSAEYGTTLVSAAFVRRCLSEVGGDRQVLRRIEHGHIGYQDLYVVAGSARTDLSSLPLRRGLSGHVDGGWMDERGVVHMHGWATDFDSARADVRLEVFADERLVQTWSPDRDRPDVAQLFGATALRSGWTTEFSLGVSDPAVWISVDVTDARAVRHTISFAQLREMLAW